MPECHKTDLLSQGGYFISCASIGRQLHVLHNLTDGMMKQAVLTQLIQQGGDGVQDHLNSTFGFACIVLCLLGVVRCLKDNKYLHRNGTRVLLRLPGGVAHTMEAIIISWSASAFFFASSCSAELS